MIHGKICKISAIYDRPDVSPFLDYTSKDDPKQAKLIKQTDDCKTSSVVDDVDKPFKCQYCPKSFQKVAKLIVHNRVHTGESKLYLYTLSYSHDIKENTVTFQGLISVHKLIVEKHLLKLTICKGI